MSNPDLLIQFNDGTVEVWEVKPRDMLPNLAVREQISESSKFAESRGFGFKVWTEDDSGLKSCHCIIEWAKDYLKSIGDTEYIEHHKEVRRKMRRRYYEKISKDKIDIWCDFCQEMHIQLRLTYERNIKKNGRYVCIRENGFLVGKKAKDHLKKINPYARDGKKQCSTCCEVKSIDDFDVRRASWDGLAPRCKQCNKQKLLERKIG